MRNDTPLTEDQKALAERYIPLARSAAGQLARKYGAHRIDVQSACYLGLVYAARAWPGEGSFANYAWYQMRTACQRAKIEARLIQIPDRKLRADGDHVRADAGGDRIEAVGGEPGPPATAAARDEVRALRVAIDSLPPIQADAIRSMYLGGETIREWSGRHGLGKGKAEYTRALAVDGLRAGLAWHDAPPPLPCWSTRIAARRSGAIVQAAS